MKVTVTLVFDDVNGGGDLKTLVDISGEAAMAVSKKILSQRIANRIDKRTSRGGRRSAMPAEAVAQIMEGHNASMSLREIKEAYNLAYSPMTIRRVILSELAEAEKLRHPILPVVDSLTAMKARGELPGVSGAPMPVTLPSESAPGTEFVAGDVLHFRAAATNSGLQEPGALRRGEDETQLIAKSVARALAAQGDLDEWDFDRHDAPLDTYTAAADREEDEPTGQAPPELGEVLAQALADHPPTVDELIEQHPEVRVVGVGVYNEHTDEIEVTLSDEPQAGDDSDDAPEQSSGIYDATHEPGDFEQGNLGAVPKK